MRTTSWAVGATLAIAIGTALGACGGGAKSASSGSADTTAVTTDRARSTGDSATAATSTGDAAASATAPSDANIMALISEANNAEIQAARAALTKGASAGVRSFAQQMIHDHRRMQAQGDRLAKQLLITPQPPASDSLAQHVQQEQSQLSGLKKGPEFDRAYVTDQVADHQSVLAMLQQFQSTAQHPELKDLIAKAIPNVQSHLDRAQKLQGTLGTTT